MASFVVQSERASFNRSEAISSLLSRIEENMERRRRNLDSDKEAHQSVGGRTVSSNLANVKGFQKHLSHMKTVRLQKANEEVPDAWGHGTVRKGELHLKYQLR